MKTSCLCFLTLVLGIAAAPPSLRGEEVDDVTIWLSGKTLAQWAEEKRQRERAELAGAQAPEPQQQGEQEPPAAPPAATVPEFGEDSIDGVVIDILSSRRRAAIAAAPAHPAARPPAAAPGSPAAQGAAEVPRAWRAVLATARNDGERALLAVLLVCGERLHRQRGIPVAATVAMALHESGYGHSSLAATHHNFFGMKARAFEDFVRLPTRELGKMVRAQFRSFSDLQAGIEGFGDFLQRPLYKRAFSRPLGHRAFIATLLACGYCPEPDYLTCIDQIVRRHHLDLLEPSAGDAGYTLAGRRMP